MSAELPSFENVPKSLNVNMGLTLEIVINVRGFPLPGQVSWFKDGEPLQKSRRTIIQYIERNSRLEIHDTALVDAGLYECYAENEHGNNKCTIPVKIIKVKLER